MSIDINVDGVMKNPVSTFAGINGEKKKIKEVYVEKDGLPILVYPKSFSINNCFYLVTKNCILYSNDAIEWKEIKTNGLPESLSGAAFAYGNGVYILFYTYSGIYYRSTDLINWDLCETIYAPKIGNNISINNSSSYFGYVGNRFISIRNVNYYNSTNKVYNTEEFQYSFDGIEWNNMSGLSGFHYKATTSSQISRVYIYSDFYHLNGIYVCKAYCGVTTTSKNYYQIIYYSNDGINWKSSALYTTTTPFSVSDHYGLNTIYCLNDFFIRKYYDSKDKKSFLYYSSDGKTWAQANLPTSLSSKSFSNVDYINGKFVIPIYNSNISGNNLYCSEDLNTWDSEYVMPMTGEPIHFVKNDDILIAYRDGGLSFFQSCYYDKINNSWNNFTASEYNEANPYIRKIVYCNGMFFMIGYETGTNKLYIFYSLSGINYLPRNIVSDNEISINTNNDIFYIGDSTT